MRGTYSDWSRKQQSLSYIFKEQITQLFEEYQLDDLFDCSDGHPPVLREYLGIIDLETLVILEKVFLIFVVNLTKKLDDPVWKTVSMKIRKYDPFINIDVLQYKKRDVVHG